MLTSILRRDMGGSTWFWVLLHEEVLGFKQRAYQRGQYFLFTFSMNLVDHFLPAAHSFSISSFSLGEVLMIECSTFLNSERRRTCGTNTQPQIGNFEAQRTLQILLFYKKP